MRIKKGSDMTSGNRMIDDLEDDYFQESKRKRDKAREEYEDAIRDIEQEEPDE